MKNRHILAATLVAAAIALTGCSDANIIDGKATVEVPNPSGTPTTVPCYLLEVDRQSSSGETVGETYLCVSRAEWDANQVDEKWVDANGRLK